MNQEDFEIIVQKCEKTKEFLPGRDHPLSYVMNIEILRKFGWRNMGYPKCYGVSFKKEKVCMYMEAPEQLTAERQESWAQAVFNAIADKTISFTQLKPSQKYLKKPRIMLFNVNPMVVNQGAYECETLPLVVVAGDAQIDPHYNLGHGIQTGMARVKALLDHIKIDEGCITYFDGTEYYNSIHELIADQQRAICKFVDNRVDYFSEWLMHSRRFYQKVLDESTDPELRALCTKRLEEITAHLEEDPEEFINCLDVGADKENLLVQHTFFGNKNQAANKKTVNFDHDKIYALQAN